MMQIDSLVVPVAMREEIFSRLDALAAELGVAVGHLYGVLVQQAGIQAIQAFIKLGFLIFGAFFFILWLRWWLRNMGSARWRVADEDTAEENRGLRKNWSDAYKKTGEISRVHEDKVWSNLIGLFVSGVLLTVLLIATVASLCSLPTYLLNPEYWALQEILSMF